MKKLIILLCAAVLCSTSCISFRRTDDISLPSYEKTEKKITDETETEPETETESETLPETEPEPLIPFAETDITITAVGDNLIHPNIYIDAASRVAGGQGHDFLPMYTDVMQYIEAADIAFINQETVMAGADYGYSGWPTFNAPQQLGLDLVSIGFDVVNIANNHMLDKGTGGLENTIDFWNEQGITLLGGYLNDEDYADIRITEEDGVRIAWLSYTYGTNGIVKNASSPIVIPYIDDALILSDLEAAGEISDFVIVSIHWGNENTYTPTDEQYRLAQMIADNGADVILGHHSHCVQPIEWIDTDRGQTLCVYSLGNFVSGMARPMNQVGGMFSFRIVSDGEGGLTVDSPLFTPTVFYYGMDWYDTHLYLMEDYTDEIAARHGVQISGYYMSVGDARKIVTDTIAGEFLPEYLKTSADSET